MSGRSFFPPTTEHALFVLVWFPREVISGWCVRILDILRDIQLKSSCLTLLNAPKLECYFFPVEYPMKI